jgi:ribosomal protein L18E
MYDEVNIYGIDALQDVDKDVKVIITPLLDAENITKKLHECGYMDTICLSEYYMK